jgi:AbrB family looped-hinge helix DNA binding protein
MSTVTISPKFQVIIPKSLRESLGIRPGEKLRVMRHGDRIEMIPIRSPKQMRGFLKGLDPTIKRDEDCL